jgi:hypothetical protein
VSVFTRVNLHRTRLFAIVVARSSRTRSLIRNLLTDKEVSVCSDQEDPSFESSKDLSLYHFVHWQYVNESFCSIRFDVVAEKIEIGERL